MKKSILTLVLIVVATMCFSQKPVRRLTYYLDTFRIMSWDKGLSYDLAQKNNSITYSDDIHITNSYVVVDLDSNKVTYYLGETNEIWETYKLKSSKFSDGSYFYECYVGGLDFPQKVLVTETVTNTYCVILQYAAFNSKEISGGYFDREVKIKVE